MHGQPHIRFSKKDLKYFHLSLQINIDGFHISECAWTIIQRLNKCMETQIPMFVFVLSLVFSPHATLCWAAMHDHVFYFIVPMNTTQVNLTTYENIRRRILMPQAECCRYEYKFAEYFDKNNNQHKSSCLMDSC